MTKPQTVCRQLEQFLSALFQREELIELRFIESWLSGSKRRSRVVRVAKWLPLDEVIARHGDLTAFARRERANIYFGVCPRAKVSDADDQSIQTVRCVWCDVDRVTAEEVRRRWSEAGIPCPSIVVSNGSGVHAYWLLQQDLKSHAERSILGAMLPEFYRSFGGDHVQNLSRILRLPGTVNYKHARNGRRPLPCTLCACDPDLRYALDAFAHGWRKSKTERRRRWPNRVHCQRSSPGPSMRRRQP